MSPKDKIHHLYHEIYKINKDSEDFKYVVKQFKSLLRTSLKEYDRETFRRLRSLLLHTRDMNYGRGHYTLAYHLLHEMMTLAVKETNPNILDLPVYYTLVYDMVDEKIGSWKDIKHFMELIVEKAKSSKFYMKYDMESIIRDHIRCVIVPQLVEDRKNHSVGDDFSMCAKWLPRERSKNPTYKWLAKLIAKEYVKYTQPHFPNNKSSNREKYRIYRQLICKLNKYLDTVEIHMCNNEWRILILHCSSILFEEIPSRIFKFQEIYVF